MHAINWCSSSMHWLSSSGVSKHKAFNLNKNQIINEWQWIQSSTYGKLWSDIKNTRACEPGPQIQAD